MIQGLTAISPVTVTVTVERVGRMILGLTARSPVTVTVTVERERMIQGLTAISPVTVTIAVDNNRSFRRHPQVHSSQKTDGWTDQSSETTIIDDMKNFH